MFYVKLNLGNDACIKAPIFEDNTFTTCVDCGSEVQIDLNEAIIDGGLDFYGSGCRCEECSYKHALQHRDEPWAEMLIADYLASKTIDPLTDSEARRRAFAEDDRRRFRTSMGLE